MLDLEAVLPVRCQQISIVPHVPHLQSTQLVSIPIRLLQFRNVIPTHEAKETPKTITLHFYIVGDVSDRCNSTKLDGSVAAETPILAW